MFKICLVFVGLMMVSVVYGQEAKPAAAPAAPAAPTVAPSTTEALLEEARVASIAKLTAAKDAIIAAEKATLARASAQIKLTAAVEAVLKISQTMQSVKQTAPADPAGTAAAMAAATTSATAAFTVVLDASVAEVAARDAADVALSAFFQSSVSVSGRALINGIVKDGGSVDFSAGYLKDSGQLNEAEAKEVADRQNAAAKAEAEAKVKAAAEAKAKEAPKPAS